jgi:hypothetical protein
MEISGGILLPDEPDDEVLDLAECSDVEELDTDGVPNDAAHDESTLIER